MTQRIPRFSRSLCKRCLATQASEDLQKQGPPERRLQFPPLPSPRDLLRLYNVSAKAQLSQNFLTSHAAARQIATAAGSLKGALVYEIGPGPGLVTREIIRGQPYRLVTVEKDYRFMPMLAMLKSAARGTCRMKNVIEDVLKHDFKRTSKSFPFGASWEDEPPPLFVIGNLPFNVSLPFIIRMFRHIDSRSGVFAHGRARLCLTFQKEVCERMVADVMPPGGVIPPGRIARGRLSVTAQSLCHVRHVTNLPGDLFFPAPACDVGLVTFTPRVQPLIPVPFKYLEKLVEHAMRYKRRYCVRGLMELFPREVALEWALTLCREAGVDHRQRSVELTLDHFYRLAVTYHDLCMRHDGLLEYTRRDKDCPLPHSLIAASTGLDSSLTDPIETLDSADDTP